MANVTVTAETVAPGATTDTGFQEYPKWISCREGLLIVRSALEEKAVKEGRAKIRQLRSAQGDEFFIESISGE